MIIMCDSFDYEDYPVYVLPGEDPKEVTEFYSHCRVKEVYNLDLPIKPQLNEYFCLNY